MKFKAKFISISISLSVISLFLFQNFYIDTSKVGDALEQIRNGKLLSGFRSFRRGYDKQKANAEVLASTLLVEVNKLEDKVHDVLVKVDQVEDILKGLKIKVPRNFNKKLSDFKVKVEKIARDANQLHNKLKNKKYVDQRLQDEVEKVLAKYSRQRKQIDQIEDHIKGHISYIDHMVKNFDKSISKVIADIKACKHAGEPQDHRSIDRQYFCDEIPLGKTLEGTSYHMYLNDYGIKQAKNNYPPKHMMYRLLSRLAKKAKNQKKMNYAQFKQKHASQYREWKNYKQYFEFPIEYKDKKGKRHYDIKIKGSRKFLDDFKLFNQRAEYKGLLAYSSSCMQIPGVEVMANKTRFKYTWLKTWLGSLTEKVKVTFPSARLKNIRFCGLFKLDLRDLKKPRFNVISVAPPKFQGLRVTPLKIHFKGGLLSFVNKFIKVFTFGITDLNKIANSFIKGEQRKFEKDIKSGKFFVKVIQDTALKQYSHVVSKTHHHYDEEIADLSQEVNKQRGLKRRFNDFKKGLGQLINIYKRVYGGKVENYWEQILARL